MLQCTVGDFWQQWIIIADGRTKEGHLIRDILFQHGARWKPIIISNYEWEVCALWTVYVILPTSWSEICPPSQKSFVWWLVNICSLLDDVYIRKESQRQLERRQREQEDLWLTYLMPAGVSWGRYLTFLAASLASALAGSQMVHVYYKPSLVRFLFCSHTLKNHFPVHPILDFLGLSWTSQPVL